jgi:hypothetical protein
MGITDGPLIEDFLATGELDPADPGWGAPPAEVESVLKRVLVRIVRYRAARAPLRAGRPPADPAAAVAARAGPLVHGLLPPDRAPAALSALAARVQVVTPAAYPAQVGRLAPSEGWCLANLLLDDLGAPPLGDEAPELDGFCAGGLAWVLPRAFALPTDPDDPVDVIVHEVAHLLHRVPGAALGLGPDVAPLIGVPDARAEVFAYAAELWSVRVRAAAESRPLDPLLRAARRLQDARAPRAPVEAALRAAAAAPPGEGFRALLEVALGPQPATGGRAQI